MSPVSRHDRTPKPSPTETPVQDHKTPLRLFRNTFKGNQTPMTVVMLVVLLGMVAYLAPSGRGSEAPDNVVARVYGREILRRDVDQALEEMIRRMGNQQNIQSLLPFIQPQALSQLINQKLGQEMAERRGIVVTDQEVKNGLEERLRQYDVFMDKGQLKPTSEIVGILRENGIALRQWEEETRNKIMLQKLLEMTAAQIPADEAWMNLENRIQNEKITFEFAALAPDTNAITDPGDGPLEAYLKASGARFQFGPRRVLQYVSVDQTAFADSLKVDEAALKSAYEAKKNQYLELDASHILFRAQSDAEFAEATRKAEELRPRLLKGEDFGKTAADLSEDPTAKTNKGRLNWFKQGAMVKPFEDAAMTLKVGEISQPVRTSFGIHLIKLEGRREKAFEDVKEELKAQLTKDRFATQAKDRLEQLRKRVGDKGDLAAAARNLKLPVDTSLPLLNDPGTVIDKIPNAASSILSEVFQMKVGQVSKVIEAGDRFVVFRVQEEKPLAVPPLKEIRAKVLAAWKLEEARKKAAAKAKAALDAKDLAALATPTPKENVTIQSLGNLGQHPAIRKALLDTPVDAFTPVLWTPEGQVWVARLKARTPAEPLTFEKRRALVQSIQFGSTQQILEAERKDLDTQGRKRPGFSSFWGRFGGIWINPKTPYAQGGIDPES